MMFPSKRISALEAQVADLTSQISTLTAQRDGLQGQLANVITAEAHAAVVAERDAFQARVIELEGSARTAGQQAADIAASVAVPPVASEPGTPAPKSAAELRAAFDAETNPTKKAALWRELSAAMK